MSDNFWKRAYLITDSRRSLQGRPNVCHEVHISTRNEFSSIYAFKERKGVHPFWLLQPFSEAVEFQKQYQSRYQRIKDLELKEIIRECQIEPYEHRYVHRSLRDFYKSIGWDNAKRKWI